MNTKYLTLILMLLIGVNILSFAQPNPPANLTVTEESWRELKYAKLNWDHVPGPFVRYSIYKKEGGVNDTGSFVKIHSYFFMTSFRDRQVSSGKTYSYYVTAANQAGESLPSETVEITISSVQQKALFSGNLVDAANGNPIFRGMVQLIPMRSWFHHAAVTDSLGNFSVEVPAGEYFIFVHAFGYVPEYYDNVHSLSAATKVTFTPGQNLSLNLDLQPYTPPVVYTVSGSVKNAAGSPLNSKIEVFRNNIMARVPHAVHAATDSAGNWSAKVREGDTIVVFAAPRDPNYLPEYYNDKKEFAEADRIVITQDVNGIDFVLEERPVYASGISGSVKNSEGEGVLAHVTAFRLRALHPGQFRYSTVTDSLGNYSLTNLQPGEYVLFTVPTAEYKPTYFRYDGQQAIWWRNADSVVVTETSQITGINFIVLPRTGGGFANIVGKVRDTNGLGINGAFVYAYDENDQAAFAISDAAGSYSITGLEPGEYKVTTDKFTYNSPSQQTVVLDYSQATSASASFTLSTSGVTGVKENKTLPSGFTLEQNYPNPFNPSTQISFALAQTKHVTLKIYNLIGQEVAVLVNEVKVPGTYTVTFNAEGFTSGVYFYELSVGGKISMKKMILMK